MYPLSRCMLLFTAILSLTLPFISKSSAQEEVTKFERYVLAEVKEHAIFCTLWGGRGGWILCDKDSRGKSNEVEFFTNQRGGLEKAVAIMIEKSEMQLVNCTAGVSGGVFFYLFLPKRPKVT